MKFAPRRPLSMLLAAASCAALVACQKHGDAAGSQVAARVNGVELSVHQVQAMLERSPQQAAQLGAQAKAEALRQLIEQELAAQAAAQDKLVNEPRLIQLQALQQRELIARAYLDTVAAKTDEPDYKALNAFIEAHKAGFDDHRQFVVEEVLLLEPPERIEALQKLLAGVKGWDRIWLKLQAENVKLQSRTNVLSTTQLSDAAIAGLSAMQEGDFSMKTRPQGGALLQVMRKNEALPLGKKDKGRIARELIMAERRGKAIEMAMDGLKARAKIEFVGEGEAARSLLEGKASAGAAPVASQAVSH